MMRLRYAGLLGYLASVIAVPTVLPDPIFGTHSSALSRPRDVSKHYSVQILLVGRHWSVFYGPYGIAVDPCNPQQFKWSGDYTDKIIDANDADHPPVPAQAMWMGGLPLYAGEDSCMIRKQGDGPPTLTCGPRQKDGSWPSLEGPFTYIDDFKEDVQYKDPAITCRTGAMNGLQYRRAWAVEYFG
jgi:hypothetical protein